MITVSGTGASVSATSATLVENSGATATVSGNSDAVTLNGSTLTATGSSDVLTVNGTGNVASASSATATVAANAALIDWRLERGYNGNECERFD